MFVFVLVNGCPPKSAQVDRRSINPCAHALVTQRFQVIQVLLPQLLCQLFITTVERNVRQVLIDTCQCLIHSLALSICLKHRRYRRTVVTPMGGVCLRSVPSCRVLVRFASLMCAHSRHGGAGGPTRHLRMDGSRAGPSVIISKHRGGGVFLWMRPLRGMGFSSFLCSCFFASGFGGWCVGYELLALLGPGYFFAVCGCLFCG